MKRLVVFGANSFSGQDFVDLALETGEYDVLGVSRSAERGPVFLRYKRFSAPKNYRYAQLDMNRNTSEILELLDSFRPHCIVNFAAQSEVAPSWEHPEHWFQTNTVALAHIVNHLRRQNYLERYLHISSPEAYGSCEGVVKEGHPDNPSTPYAASKAAADMLLSVYRKQFGFPLLTVRATNVYGARQQLFKIIPRSVIMIKKGSIIELHGGGEAIKSYIHIRDVSRGELAVLNHGELGRMYHLSPTDGVAVKDVVGKICELTGADFSRSTKVVDERPGQDRAYVIDSTLARISLGWKPEVSLERGLSEVVEWVNSNWDEIRQLPHGYEHKE